MTRILEAVRELRHLLEEDPGSIAGAQKRFGTEVPTARLELREALLEELSGSELEVLSEALGDLVESDEGFEG